MVPTGSLAVNVNVNECDIALQPAQLQHGSSVACIGTTMSNFTPAARTVAWGWSWSGVQRRVARLRG